jgi:hypothetical protein
VVIYANVDETVMELVGSSPVLNIFECNIKMFIYIKKKIQSIRLYDYYLIGILVYVYIQSEFLNENPILGKFRQNGPSPLIYKSINFPDSEFSFKKSSYIVYCCIVPSVLRVLPSGLNQFKL